MGVAFKVESDAKLAGGEEKYKILARGHVKAFVLETMLIMDDEMDSMPEPFEQ